MATKLDKPLKREVLIEGKPYMLTISPQGLGAAQGLSCWYTTLATLRRSSLLMSLEDSA